MTEKINPKWFTPTWHKNRDIRIQFETDLNYYRDVAYMDLKFAIKLLLYDSDIRLRHCEIAKIMGINYGYMKYILNYMARKGEIGRDKNVRPYEYYIEGKPSRIISKGKERFSFKTIDGKSSGTNN